MRQVSNHLDSAIITTFYPENILSASVVPVPEAGSEVLTNDTSESVEEPQGKLLLPLSAHIQ